MSNPYAPPPPDSPEGSRERAVPPAPPAGDAARPPLGLHPPVTAAPAPPPPPDPEALARIGRLVRHFGVWLVAGVLVSMLPLPWRLASLAFLAGAAVAGVRALRSVVAARVRGGLAPMLAVGLAMTAVLGVSTLGTLALWSADTARQECLSGALTRSAQAACERDYRDAVADLTRGVTGGS